MRIVLALLLITTSLLADDGLVANPGFEELTEDGKQLVTWGLPVLPGAEFAWDDEVKHSGARSGRIVSTDPEKQSRYVQAWRQDINDLPEGERWLSIWVKGHNLTQGRINVLHRDEKGQVLKNQGVAGFDGTFDWREIAARLERVPGAVGIQLVIGVQKSTGTAWFDDVSVVDMADLQGMFGRMSMTPAEPQAAGATVPAAFDFTLGDRGLAQGGELRIRFGHWRPAREFRLRGFRVECPVEGAVFETSVPPRKTSWPPTPKPIACVATLAEGGPLPPGITVRIAADLTYTSHTNVAVDVEGLVAASPGSAAYPAEGAFNLRAKGGPAAQIMCTALPRPLADEPGRVTVAVVDQYGNPSSDFRGTVRLWCNTDAGLPVEYTFTPADAGSHEFAGRFAAGPVSRVTATSGEMSSTSNPILPRTVNEPGIYFGDIHSHCEISGDGVGDPDLGYEYAKRFFGLDLAALSDHSPTGAQWTRAMAAANTHNDPGRFVTFVAYEWSDSRRGHRNAYYRGDSGLEQPRGLPDNMETWWSLLDQQDQRVLTIPHHPNTQSVAKRPDGKSVWGPVDWSQINGKYQRVVELCQNRGSFEVPGPNEELRVVRDDVGSSVQAALAKGHRLGFIGSTDAHSGRPGDGIARVAIISPEFTREALWDAMHDRRSYATSGKHILLLFSLNEAPMGSELALEDAGAPRTVSWRVIGTGPINRVDLLRSNLVVKSWDGAGRDDVAGEFAAIQPMTEAEWWYLRAIQEDGHMAWGTPVWVDPPEG